MSVVKISQDSFKQEISSGVVLVDFYADWCGPCKMIAPVLEQLAEEFVGKVKIGKVDVDQAPLISQQFNIFSIPTLILFKDGEKIDEVAGFQSKDMLIKLIQKAL